MKKYTITVLAFVLVALCIVTGCKQKPSAFPLSLATLEQIHSGQLSYEERDGEIFVSVTDSSGDCHIHRLNHKGHSRLDALEILQKKQTELEKAGPQGADTKIQKSRGENWAVLDGDWPVEPKGIPEMLLGSRAYLERTLAGKANDLERSNVKEILSRWDAYSCQLLPMTEKHDGRKIVVMRFFPTREPVGMFRKWRIEPVIVRGGGNDYWSLRYDPEKKEYSGLVVNASK
ncbi:MAG: hypothetical protein K8R87_04485 [Verrucomicrobia bacterium]|nr:hypothetical protein [Verrucomicrobiota bacterium]